MAKQNNLSLFIGTDFQYVFTILDATDTEVVDITGWALSFQAKVNPEDTAAVLELTTDAAEITITGTFDDTPALNTLTATVTIADTDTDDLTPGDYFWDLKRTDAGSESILAYGILTLRQSVHSS